MDHANDILDMIYDRKATGRPFALATVVRTVSATAAKAGAKAVILPDGTISEGWIGGGCARAAVLKAAREAIADGKPRLVSVQPPDALREQGIPPGRGTRGRALRQEHVPEPGHHGRIRRAGPAASRNRRLRILAGCGRSRRAREADRICDNRLRAGCRAGELRRSRPAHRRICPSGRRGRHARFIVVATQGRGDEPRCGPPSRSMPIMWRSSAAAERRPPSGRSSRTAASPRAARETQGAGRPRSRSHHPG